ncbi:hypothetical protein CH380_05050 [Leptospira adleri]|uniref:Uncharacterized protein n=1 Tax=Leptospira adleri TaxID=2023186 RepID=A0A2M9YSC6_9LEPT|nr:hypothetical protein CH380_05050 [Leptospira adleri]PJZ61291.1 hypothetical protein CH376_13880 [Leptospira adleri]
MIYDKRTSTKNNPIPNVNFRILSFLQQDKGDRIGRFLLGFYVFKETILQPLYNGIGFQT